MIKFLRLSLPSWVLLLTLALAVPAIATEGHALKTSFGPKGPGAGAFGSVNGIAVDQVSGDVYVFDATKKAIYKFNAAGEKVDFAETDSNEISGVRGESRLENELAVDSSTGPDHGDIYVANTYEILVYDGASGHRLGSLTLPSSSMCGVAVDAKGEVYVGAIVYGVYSRFFEHMVRKYTPHSNPVTEADYVSSLYQLQGGPGEDCNVAADSQGEIYVDEGGVAVRKYGSSQFNDNEVAAVTSPPESNFDERGMTLAVDPSTDNVYIDEGNDVVQYASTGEPLAAFGAEAKLAGSYGVAVNSTSKYVYVASGSGKVDIFEPVTLPDTPHIEEEVASGVGLSEARLEAQISPMHQAATCLFQFVTEAKFVVAGYAGAESAACEPTELGTGVRPVSASASLAGLGLATTYHYRVLATNGAGTTTGPDRTFKTMPLPPVVATGQAVAGTGASEVVSGAVSPLGKGIWDAEYRIEYGLTSAYGSEVEGDAGSGDAAVGVSSVIPELRPGVTYHYRVSARSAGGESVGADETFTVPTITPSVGAPSVQFINEQSATILGELNPEGLQTTYEVQYGTTVAYGESTPALEMAGLTSSQGTITEIVGLSPGALYHYRLVASNAAGTTYGPDETFATVGAPSTSTFTSFAIPSAPQIAVAPFKFPDTGVSATKTTPKALTSKQKLAAALKLCAKKSKHKQASCRKQARKRYGPKRKAKKK